MLVCWYCKTRKERRNVALVPNLADERQIMTPCSHVSLFGKADVGRSSFLDGPRQDPLWSQVMKMAVDLEKQCLKEHFGQFFKENRINI
jgi:hypothetical protein